MNNNHEILHMVMFPWLAFGHMIPFLELSKSLAKKGHRVSFVSTPRNIQRLPKIPPSLAPLLNFIELPFPDQVEQLPDQAEATSDVPHDKIQYLKKAFDGLKSPLCTFLEASKPDWIIYDFAPHWLPPIAAKLGVHCVYFSVFNASMLCFFGSPLVCEVEDARTKPEHFTVPPKWVPFPSNMAYRIFESQKLFDVVEENESGVSDMFRLESTIQGCDVVAVRTCTEFESEWLSLLQDVVYLKPVLPVGLLPPDDHIDDLDDDTWQQIGEWLDKQKHKSVVYVAFGSEAKLSQEEITQISLGLELSELPFFWVLKPAGSTTENDISLMLPPGFQERTRGCGIIYTSWAPQLKILSHTSVGGFLTHSGWSSVIESLGLGCPLILFPLMNAQELVARLLVWKKIGLEIPRDEMDGSFTKESVAESLRKVMVDQEGESYRKAAIDLKEVFGDKALQDQYFNSFARYIKDYV